MERKDDTMKNRHYHYAKLVFYNKAYISTIQL